MAVDETDGGVLERYVAVGLAAIPIIVLCLWALRIDVRVGDPVFGSVLVALFPASALVAVFARRSIVHWSDIVLLMLALVGATSLLINAAHLPMTVAAMGGDFLAERKAAMLGLSGYSAALGSAMFLLFAEAVRRAFGWAMFVLALCWFAAYAALGLWGQEESIRIIGPVALRMAAFPSILTAEFLRSIGGAVVFAAVLIQSPTCRAAIDRVADSLAGCRGGAAAVAVLAHAAFGATHGRPGTSLSAVGPIFGPLLLAEGHPPHRVAAFLVCGAAGSMFMIPVLADSVFVWAEFVAMPVQRLLLPCGIMAAVFFLGLFLQAFFLSKTTRRARGRAGRWHLARGIGGGIALVAAAIGMLTYHVFVLAAVGLILLDTWRAGRGARLHAFGDLVERAGRRVIRFVVAVTVLGMLIDPVLVASTLLVGGVPHIEPEGPAAALSAMMFAVSGDPAAGLAVAVVATLILGAMVLPHPAYLLCVSVFGGFFAAFGAPPTAVHAFVFALTVASVFATPLSRHVFAAAALAAASPMRTAATAAVLGSRWCCWPWAWQSTRRWSAWPSRDGWCCIASWRDSERCCGPAPSTAT